MALTKVTSSLVKDDAVTSAKIVDGGIATADIATNAITSTKIAQNSILTKHIDDGQVTTAQLGADAVTAAKIADDAISEEHLDVTVITGLTEVTAATGDLLMVADISDSNNLKKIPVSSILAGTHTGGSSGTHTGAVNTSGTIQGARLGLGVAPHGTAGLNITTTDQHIRLNNGSELGIISLDSNGILDIWAHGDGESLTLRTGTGSGTAALTIAGVNTTFAGTISSGAITSGSHLINASSSAFGGSSVQGFNTDFLVDTGQGYSRHNSYHTGGSNHQFLVNATSSTTNTVALSINKDANATFAGTISSGAITIGSSTVATPNAAADDFVIKGSGTAVGMTIAQDSASGTGTIFFGDTANSAAGGFRYNHNTGDMAISAEDFVNFNADGLQIGGTTFLDSSINLTNIGTISSGAITSSGTVTAGSQITVSNGSTTSTYGFRHEGAGKFMRMGMPNASFAYFETDSTNGFYLDGNTTVNGSLLTKNSDAFSVAGIALRDDVADFIRSENPPINVNRLSNNGDQIRFHQAGTLIGSIGSEGGDSLYIQSDGTGGGGLRFHNSGGIQPLRNGATIHNTIDLGTSTRAFKDFYTAGMASVGHVVPNTAGTYTVNHLGVYASGITINAASSQTGWLMAAGNGKLSWASGGAMAGADGLGFHSTMVNRVVTDQTTATKMQFYLNDVVAGEWKRTGSGGSIRPNQYSSGDTAANLPGLASYDDENTGVYWPAADNLGISVGGSQAVLIDSDKYMSVGNESAVPNNLAGLHVKKGGLLINGSSASSSGIKDVGHLSNYWTFFGSSGQSGTYSGNVRISVPAPTGTSGNAWGGFQLEVYISGYSGKYCSAMLSGYTNNSITLSEATIIRSSGSHSVSYGTITHQGFYFDIDIPSYIHPSVYYRITKAGDPSSDHETDFKDLTVTIS